MKNYFWIMLTVLIVLITSPFYLGGNPIDLVKDQVERIIADEYYVLIDRDGKKVKGIETPEDKEVWNREYTLKAYDEEGKEKEVNFYGYKNLRKGAYLRLSIISGDVQRYEEVKENQVPLEATEKLKTLTSKE
ncbi:YxeA family protein [Salinithrix halophila]|uniref:YxeA family protein n=1 Tax=Salinithrix halophila TaxID=1485204 RepID=A0ABV8J9T8_9BACL